MNKKFLLLAFALFCLPLIAGTFDHKAIVAGNMALATIPCAMLWITVNLKKETRRPA